jgi:peptidoglycan hydrolase-like protein with peptidoglycan-binding domain
MSLTAQAKQSLNDNQRAWLKKLGAALQAPVSGGADLPLGGVFPEVLWDQKKAAVAQAESNLKELESAQIASAAALRKEFDRIRGLEQQKKLDEALKAFDAFEPRIKAEYDKLNKARGSGVQIPEDGKGDGKATPGAPTTGADPNVEQYKKEKLKVGSKGPAVEYLQKTLGGGLKVDGKFGPATQKAVQAFQKSKGLQADGVVGPKTWGALAGGAPAAPAGTAAPLDGGAAKAGADAGAPAKAATGFISSSVGKGGKNLPDDVKAVQEALNKYGDVKVPTDGKYGPAIQKAIEEFQKKLGQFKPDGVIQPGRGPARVLSGQQKMPPTPAEPKPIEPPVLGKATLDKGAFVWNSTREILNTNIEELKKGVRAAYGTETQDLMKAIDGSLVKLGKVVDKLDTRLADALDDAYKATTDDARLPHLKKAEGLMKEYLMYVKSEPLIDHMDGNPFGVKTSLKKVISDALKHLSELLPDASAQKS